jgi:hypothetical protein
MTESLPSGGVMLDADELDARWADAWRPENVAERLARVRTPWCIAAGWALDLFRGGQGLRLSYDVITERTAEGIPYLVTELVLLFKAKTARPKDQADFYGAMPLLGRPGGTP